MDNNFNNRLTSVVLDFLRSTLDANILFRKCPLQGTWTSENVDLDQLYKIGDKYGHVISKGYHKLEIRLKSQKNYTYETFRLVIENLRGSNLTTLNLG